MEPKFPFANCEACPLRDSPVVPSDPNKGDALYTIVGESPGRDEVIAAKQGSLEPGFVGYSGQMLWQLLAKRDVTRKQCNVTNAVLCAPPTEQDEKQEVLSAAAACCKPRLDYELAQQGGVPILALGKTARESVIGPELPGESPTTLHNRWVQLSGGRLALSTYHPAYVLRKPDEARTMFDGISKFLGREPKFLYAPTYEVVTTVERLTELLTTLGGRVSFDIETDQIDYQEDKILMLGLTDQHGHAYVIPGAHPTSPVDLLWNTRGQQLWKDFWARRDIEFTGHNAKFDIRFLRYQLAHPARVDFDTMLAHFILDERPKTHDLKGLAARYLDVPDYETGLKKYLKSRNDHYAKIPFDELCQYLAWDVTNTLRLSHVLEALLVHADQYEWPFKNIYMPLSDLFAEAELHGWKVDTEYISSKADEFESVLGDIAKQFTEMSSGEVVNLNSPKQVSHYLYETLKLPRPKSRKLKPNSTAHDALVLLQGKHPAVDLLLKHRKLDKLVSSYITNVLEMVDDFECVHCDVQLHGAETGRISVRAPALQTIPRPGEENSKVIRDSYVARPGNILGAVDYSQAELRIAAALSGEPFLLRVYEDNRDLHNEVALAMFGPEFTKEQRVHCKMFNFSYLYGGTEYSFAQDAGLPIEVARDFVHKYNDTMPQLAAWKKNNIRLMNTQHFIRYRMGLMRRIPFICNTNKVDAEHTAINAEVQGSASQMTSLSAIRARPVIRAYDAVILMLVHDSNIFECPLGLEKVVGEIIQDVMVQTAAEWFPEVKWKADIEVGERWGSLKPL